MSEDIVYVGVSGQVIINLIREAQRQAALSAASAPEANRAKVEQMACLTIIATALNITVMISDLVEDDDHDAIQQAAGTAAQIGVAILSAQNSRQEPVH